jgi:hypothetical protein
MSHLIRVFDGQHWAFRYSHSNICHIASLPILRLCAARRQREQGCAQQKKVLAHRRSPRLVLADASPACRSIIDLDQQSPGGALNK